MIKKPLLLATLISFNVLALDPIITDSTTNIKVHSTGDVTTTVKSPPPPYRRA